MGKRNLRTAPTGMGDKGAVLGYSRKVVIGLAIAAVSVFALMAGLVLSGHAGAFDGPICSAVYAARRAWLTKVMIVITYMGDWQVITGVCVLFLIFRRSRLSWGVPLSVSAILATALNKLLKSIFVRPRPEMALRLITQGGYSFPSGHSASSFAFYAMMIVLVNCYVEDKKKARLLTGLLSLLIFLIGASRVYLGVHYPTDVLGGWSEGLMLVIALCTANALLHRAA